MTKTIPQELLFSIIVLIIVRPYSVLFEPISYHWSLLIPPENIRKPNVS